MRQALGTRPNAIDSYDSYEDIQPRPRPIGWFPLLMLRVSGGSE